MRNILLSLLLLCMACPLWAVEQIQLNTDKSCYMAGELMHYEVQVQGEEGCNASRVAYIEIVDQHQMFASQMVWLLDGKGQGVIELPLSIHSGYFQVNVYTTRLLAEGSHYLHRELLAVVNPYKVCAQDRIQLQACDSLLEGGIRVEPMSDAWRPSGFVPIGQPKPLVPEEEGLILYASVSSSSNLEHLSLAVRGKGVHVSEGVQVNDTLYRFHILNVKGSQDVVLQQIAMDDQPLCDMRLLSPYVESLSVRPLPMLNVVYNDSLLRVRLQQSQESQINWRRRPLERESFNPLLFGDEPFVYYDLDEWRKFMTVREILIEFVKGIHRSSYHKKHFLYIGDQETRGTGKWATMVLLDGVPIYDIDQLLQYDARRIKYLSAFRGRYNLGGLIAHGVISLVTNEGTMPSFKLDHNSKVCKFEFPL